MSHPRPVRPLQLGALRCLSARMGPNSITQVARALVDLHGAAMQRAIFQRAGLADLLDDPHLQATGGLADVVLPDGDKAGQTVKTTLLPLALQGQRLGVRLQPPPLSAHADALLAGLGYTATEVADLHRDQVVA